MVKKNSVYDSSQIKVITDDVERIKKRPTVYIGSLYNEGIFHLIKEVIDNSIDEFIMGYGSTIHVSHSNEDGVVSIRDEGRGIPDDDEKKFKQIFTTLSSSGKFDDSVYDNSRGLNGVGLTCVNALSISIAVEIYRNGIVTTYSFVAGKYKGKTSIPTDIASGTKITFYPNMKLFQIQKMGLDGAAILQHANHACYLNKGLTIDVCDMDKNEVITIKHDNGLNDYITDISGSSVLLPKNIVTVASSDIAIDNQTRHVDVEMCFNFTPTESNKIHGFTNTIFQPDGGTHVNYVRQYIGTFFKNFIKDNNIIKRGVVLDITVEDIVRNMVCIISIRHTDPLYTSQTKSKLSSTDIRECVEKACNIELNNNMIATIKVIGNLIVNNAIERVRNKAFVESIKKVTTVGIIKSQRLAECSSKVFEDRELYIVEGRSAGGTVLQARDRKIQAMFPLRGKVLNTHDLRVDAILKNEELADLVNVLGCGIDKAFDYTKLNYNRIFIMPDMDDDGYHIALLLLTFFFKHMRPLIENGHVFYAMTPFYIIKTKANEYYAMDDVQRDTIIRKLKSEYTVQRIKGLGELNASQLASSTMNLNSRTLTPFKISDESKVTELLATLMGKRESDGKKKIIME